MALIHYSEISRDEANEGAISCEPSLVTKCLPSLSVLGQHGITSLSLMFRIEDGMEIDYAILRPRFFDAVHVTKTSRADISNAVSGLWVNISAAIEAAIADDEEGDEMPFSFFAYVTVQQCVQSPGWSIRCEVVATVADDHPDLMIRLR
jgi:hypothetical protein